MVATNCGLPRHISYFLVAPKSPRKIFSFRDEQGLLNEAQIRQKPTRYSTASHEKTIDHQGRKEDHVLKKKSGELLDSDDRYACSAPRGGRQRMKPTKSEYLTHLPFSKHGR